MTQMSMEKTAPVAELPSPAMASLLAQRGSTLAALGIYAQLVAEDPDNADMWVQKGELHSDLFDFAAARNAFERALVVAPTHARAHFRLGLIASSFGRQHAAVECFERALAHDQEHGEFRINLANGLLALDRWAAAATILEPMGDDLPGWWGSVRDNALSRLAEGRRRAEELIALREARRAPLDRGLAVELAGLFVNIGNPGGAYQICRRLLTEDADDYEVVTLWAKAVAQVEGVRGALRFLDGMAERFSGQSHHEMAMARFLFEEGDLGRALKHADVAGPDADQRAYGMMLLAAERWSDLFAFCRDWIARTDDTSPFALLLRAAAGLGRLRLFHDEGEDEGAGRADVIPPVIVQFWDTEDAPAEVSSAIGSWRDRNPGFAHRLFCEASARDFISQTHGARAATAFDHCHHAAMKADFFRVAYLSAKGGIYVDADDICVRPFSEMFKAIGDAEFVASLSGDVAPYIHNWFLAAKPNSPVLKLALEDMIASIEAIRSRGATADIWHSTGPGLITRTVARWLAENPVAARQTIFLTTRQYRGFVSTIEDMHYKKTTEGNWRRSAEIKREEAVDQSRIDRISSNTEIVTPVSTSSYSQERTSSVRNTPSHMLEFINQFMDIEWDPGMGDCLPIFRELNQIVAQTGEPLEGSLFHQTRAPLQDIPFADYRAKRRNFTAFCGTGDSLLEIGFNAGHSCLLALMANPSLRYTGIDLGEHRYTKPCFELLKSRFGERVELLVGDSRDVLPVLRRTGRRYDLYHVDGGHGFDVAHSDICNVLDFCKTEATLLVDDTDNPLIDALCDMFVMQGAMTRLHPDRMWSEQVGGWHALFRTKVQASADHR